MRKLVCFVMLTFAVLAQAKQDSQEYNVDDYWFDYEVLHSTKAPKEWLSELGVNPSVEKHIIKMSVRTNDGQSPDWKIRKNSPDEWLVTKDPYRHSRIQVYKRITDENGDSYILGLLWAKVGKEVEIDISAVIDSNFRISATLPFQANRL